MRRFRVIDGSKDGSLAVPKAEADPAPPQPDADGEPPSAGPGPRPADDDQAAADGLITARTSYDAALQTTVNIRQRSLLDFLG
jgi:hypothetical protein